MIIKAKSIITKITRLVAKLTLVVEAMSH